MIEKVDLLELRYRATYYRNAVHGIRKFVEAILADRVTKDKWVYFKEVMDACERDVDICREVIENDAHNIHYVNHKHKNPEAPKSKLVSVDVVLRGRGKGW